MVLAYAHAACYRCSSCCCCCLQVAAMREERRRWQELVSSRAVLEDEVQIWKARCVV